MERSVVMFSVTALSVVALGFILAVIGTMTNTCQLFNQCPDPVPQVQISYGIGYTEAPLGTDVHSCGLFTTNDSPTRALFTGSVAAYGDKLYLVLNQMGGSGQRTAVFLANITGALDSYMVVGAQVWREQDWGWGYGICAVETVDGQSAYSCTYISHTAPFVFTHIPGAGLENVVTHIPWTTIFEYEDQLFFVTMMCDTNDCVFVSRSSMGILFSPAPVLLLPSDPDYYDVFYSIALQNKTTYWVLDKDNICYTCVFNSTFHVGCFLDFGFANETLIATARRPDIPLLASITNNSIGTHDVCYGPTGRENCVVVDKAGPAHCIAVGDGPNGIYIWFVIERDVFYVSTALNIAVKVNTRVHNKAANCQAIGNTFVVYQPTLQVGTDIYQVDVLVNA